MTSRREMSQKMSRGNREKSETCAGDGTENVTEMSQRDIGALLPVALMRELERVASAVPPESQWTVKMVGEELTFAVRLCNKAVGRVLPADSKAAWPALLREWADLLAQVENEDGIKDEGPVRFSATRQQINRMERALVWQARYLNRLEHDQLRKVLTVWLRAKARRNGRFNQSLKRLGISRPTGYRARDRALLIIALGLMRDGITP